MTEQFRFSNVFVSYSHSDKLWLDRIMTMLKPMVEKNKITVWSDRKIKPGEQWQNAIDDLLQSADAALLLVSPDFLASDHITKYELPVVFKRVNASDMQLLWLAVRPSLYTETPLAAFQALNNPAKPLATVSDNNIEQEIVEICYKVKLALIQQEEREPIVRSRSLAKDPETTVNEALVELKSLHITRYLRQEQLHQEMTQILDSNLPMELIVVAVLEKFRGRAENELRDQVKKTEICERIESVGMDPRHYDLPTHQDALASLSASIKKVAKMNEASSGGLDILVKAMSTPIADL